MTGDGREHQDEMIKQVVHAVEQIANGEEVTPKRSLGLGGSVALVAGGLLLLLLVAEVVGSLLSFLLR